MRHHVHFDDLPVYILLFVGFIIYQDVDNAATTGQIICNTTTFISKVLYFFQPREIPRDSLPHGDT